MSIEFVPYDFQRKAIAHCLLRPRTGLWLSPGMGKSVCALTVARTWLVNLEVQRVLVVGPKRVANKTWPRQIQWWDHTKHLDYGHIVGDTRGGLVFPQGDPSIHIITRDLWPRLVEKLWSKWPYDALIWDESSGLRHAGTERFKAMRRVAAQISRMIQLTGTPAPNSMLNIWCQIWAMDAGRSLGKSYSAYKKKFFRPVDYFQRKWVPLPGAREEIYGLIKHLVISAKAEDYLELPPQVEVDVPVTLPPSTLRLYNEFKKEYLLKTPDLNTVTAANAGALINKLQQYANGCIYTDAKRVVFEELHTAKLDALSELHEEMNGESLLVPYVFKSDLARLRKRFPEARGIDDPGAMDRWIKGELPMMFLHPASAGHGLDELQYGGRNIAWFGVPWDGELYEQTNKRLDRLGQKRSGIVHRILCENTVDFRIAQALNFKRDDQGALMDSVSLLRSELQELDLAA